MSVLYLCGAGNCEAVRLAIAINRAEGRWDTIVLLDDDKTRLGEKILDVEIVGGFGLLGEADPAVDQVANLVSKTTFGRFAAQKKIEAYGLPFAGLVSPDVDISGVELAPSAIVYQHVVIGPTSTVGSGSVIFMGSVLGNGSRMGRYCVLAPNAVINARVQLGDGVYVGTNAAVLPDAHIGPWATIGACSAVLRRVPAGSTVLGVPAKTFLTLEQRLRCAAAGSIPDEIRRELERRCDDPRPPPGRRRSARGRQVRGDASPTPQEQGAV